MKRKETNKIKALQDVGKQQFWRLSEVSEAEANVQIVLGW